LILLHELRTQASKRGQEHHEEIRPINVHTYEGSQNVGPRGRSLGDG
jgi:hypothetical protein